MAVESINDHSAVRPELLEGVATAAFRAAAQSAQSAAQSQARHWPHTTTDRARTAPAHWAGRPPTTAPAAALLDFRPALLLPLSLVPLSEGSPEPCRRVEGLRCQDSAAVAPV